MDVDPLMRETRAVIKAYVTHRLAPDVPQSLNQVAEILIWLGDKMFYKHRETYEKMARSLHLKAGLSDASSVSTTVIRLAEEVFDDDDDDDEVNWGNLIKNIVLLTVAAVEMVHLFGTVALWTEMLSFEMSRVTVERHGRWIRQRGGWNSCLTHLTRLSMVSRKLEEHRTEYVDEMSTFASINVAGTSPDSIEDMPEPSGRMYKSPGFPETPRQRFNHLVKKSPPPSTSRVQPKSPPHSVAQMRTKPQSRFVRQIPTKSRPMTSSQVQVKPPPNVSWLHLYLRSHLRSLRDHSKPHHQSQADWVPKRNPKVKCRLKAQLPPTETSRTRVPQKRKAKVRSKDPTSCRKTCEQLTALKEAFVGTRRPTEKQCNDLEVCKGLHHDVLKKWFGDTRYALKRRTPGWARSIKTPQGSRWRKEKPALLKPAAAALDSYTGRKFVEDCDFEKLRERSDLGDQVVQNGFSQNKKEHLVSDGDGDGREEEEESDSSSGDVTDDSDDWTDEEGNGLCSENVISNFSTDDEV